MSRRSLQRLLVATLLTLAVSIAPASAGTAEDPELRDPCGVRAPTSGPIEVYPSYQDVCAAWIDSSYDADAQVTSMTIGLRLAGDISLRTDTYYYVFWDAGSCRYGVSVLDTGSGPRLEVWRCGAPHRLPAGAATIAGDTITWTVSFSGALADYQVHHGPGEILSEIEAGTATSALLTTFELCFGRCVELGGDVSAAQRTHKIPSSPAA